MAGEGPALEQHQTKAEGTVIMLNEHFLFLLSDKTCESRKNDKLFVKEFL